MLITLSRLKRLSEITWGRLQGAAGLWRSTVSPHLAVHAWVDQLRQSSLPEVRGHIAVLAIRNPTWIEWAVYTACWMRKLGLAPVVLYSSNDVASLYGRPFVKQTLFQRFYLGDFWEQVSSIPDVELIDIDAHSPSGAQAPADYGDFAADYAHTTAAYDLRVEEHEGWPRKQEYLAEVPRQQARLAEAGALLASVFEQAEQRYGVRRLIAYSGLIGITSAAGEAARRRGWDVVFAEGWLRPGHLICNLNSPALVYNIQGWLKSLGEWDQRKRDEIDKFLAFQEAPADFTDADWLKDFYKFQPAKATDALAPKIASFLAGDKPKLLMASNVVGDSATLRSMTIFQSQQEWISQVCDFFREHPEWKLIIRAHPAEYLLAARVVVKIGDIAKAAAKGAENILVIGGDEQVSTYALIREVHGGLIWLSTVGVDMVVRNCPVVAAAKPKYHGLGIVKEPRSKQEYFQQISSLIAGPRATSPEQKEMALKYLTIIAKEFSYKAFGPGFRACGIDLDGHPPGGDVETFYRILAGDLPMESRPPARDLSAGV